MYDLSLLKNNRPLSEAELSYARQIIDEVTHSVDDRENYIKKMGIDRGFAMPDANWSFESPNEFVKLFNRISKGNAQDLNCLRIFAPVFSGYSVLNEHNVPNFTVSDTLLDGSVDDKIAGILQEQNGPFIRQFLAHIQGLPREFILSQPAMLGEVGHWVDGFLVNRDTYTYQETIRIMHHSGLGEYINSVIEKKGSISVLEIGGGYGAICRWFMGAFPNTSYTILDLPESLLFSRLYVSLTRPDLPTNYALKNENFDLRFLSKLFSKKKYPDRADYGVRFIPNYMAEKLDRPFDLVINTLSMSEMSEHQIRKYAKLIRGSWLTEDGIFFEQNHDNTPLGLLCAQKILAEEFPCRLSPSDDDTPFNNGSPNIWSNRPVSMTKTSPIRPIQEKLLESIGQFNLVHSPKGYWCLHQSLGPVYTQKLDTRDYPPVVYFGKTADEAKQKIAEVLWKL